MARTFIAPNKYIQGPGEMGRLGSYVDMLGTKALVLISEGGLRRTGPVIEASFANSKSGFAFETFEGECTTAEIRRIMDCATSAGADVMVGVGGGKIFDTAKGAAYYLDTPVIIAPTIAATEAPC